MSLIVPYSFGNGGSTDQVVTEDATNKFSASTSTIGGLAPIITNVTRYTYGKWIQVVIDFKMPAGSYSSVYMGDIFPNNNVTDDEDYLPYHNDVEILRRQFKVFARATILNINNNTDAAFTLSSDYSISYATPWFLNLGLFH